MQSTNIVFISLDLLDYITMSHYTGDPMANLDINIYICVPAYCIIDLIVPIGNASKYM